MGILTFQKEKTNLFRDFTVYPCGILRHEEDSRILLPKSKGNTWEHRDRIQAAAGNREVLFPSWATFMKTSIPARPEWRVDAGRLWPHRLQHTSLDDYCPSPYHSEIYQNAGLNR